MENSTVSFRSSFRVLWRWTTGFCGAFGVLLYAMGILTGTPMPIALTASMSLGMGTLFVIAILACPIYVSSGHIRCYNYYGIYVNVPWQSMTSVRSQRLFGLPYLHVSSSATQLVITIPLYLSDMETFIDLVAEYAGDDHPLTIALLES